MSFSPQERTVKLWQEISHQGARSADAAASSLLPDLPLAALPSLHHVKLRLLTSGGKAVVSIIIVGSPLGEDAGAFFVNEARRMAKGGSYL